MEWFGYDITTKFFADFTISRFLAEGEQDASAFTVKLREAIADVAEVAAACGNKLLKDPCSVLTAVRS